MDAYHSGPVAQGQEEDGMAALRIVIADDHPLFRDALRLTIVEGFPGVEIIEAHSFDSLRARLETEAEIDLVLLDLKMPGMQGLSGLLFMRAAFAAVPVAIISAEEDEGVVRRALDLGAIGYIAKSTGADGIRAALAALLSGGAWIPDTLGRKDPAADRDAVLAARLARLTPQQIRVLMMLSEGHPNKRIAHALGVSEATVKAHVSAILERLEVDNRTQAVILARRIAAISEETPPS
jgi:DNA-binding NarL/FixJ family response regulator